MKNDKSQIKNDIHYVLLVNAIDENVDYLGSENPVGISKHAWENVDKVLREIHKKYGVNAYNDIVDEFELRDKIRIFD